MIDTNTDTETYQTNSINLHSLINFKDIIEPLILQPSIQSVCEIGVENCNLTSLLASLSKSKNFYYCGVDPTIDSIPVFHGESKLFREESLSYLSRKEADHDLFLIDGDHNYYTVYHELRSIFLRKKNKQSICFLHDVLPPCGNRDFYYNPSIIPKAFIHPHSYTFSLNSNFKISDYGFRSCGKFALALESGNPKNGVAEAIKDFLTIYQEELDLKYFVIPLFYGLGILYSRKLIAPANENFLAKKNIYRLLANENLFRHIENNRIKLYIELISKQQILEEKSKKQVLIKSELTRLTLSILKEKVPFLYNMSKKNYLCLKKLTVRKITSLNEILIHCQNSEIISFDFFDTIVHRTISPPDTVKLKTAEYACIKLEQIDCYLTPEKFNKIRDDEEKKLCDDNFYKYGKDKEADIVSILQHTLAKISSKNHDSLIIKIIAYEVINEINHLYININIKKILAELKNQGKKIIICSDMYLLEEHIKQIADHFDISCYIDKIYVSSTEKLNKGSGHLYQYILNDLKCEAKKILHIGDNFISDYLAPTKINIPALYYHNREILNNYKNTSKLLDKINIHKKKLNSRLINKLTLITKLKNYLPYFPNKNNDYDTISAYCAPVFALFAYQALRDMYSTGIRKVFFLAREGIQLKKIFFEILNQVLLFKDVKDDFKFEILYISRLSSSCGNYRNMRNVEALIETTSYSTGCLSIQGLLKAYGLSINDFSETTLKIIKPYANYIDKISLLNLLTESSFGKEIDQLLKNQRKLLECYLSEQGVLSEGKIGLVDLGGGGTIQKNISYFLPDYPTTEFFGYYFATNNLISDKTALSLKRSTFIPGYIVSYQNHYKMEKFSGGASFLESICGCDEIGTTIAYQVNQEGSIIPIFDTHSKITPYNIIFQKKIMQKILYDVKKFSAIFDVAYLPLEKIKDYATKRFLKFLVKPKNLDLKKLHEYTFNHNWSSNLETPLINLINFSDVFKPFVLLKKIQKSPWRYGSIASTPIPFLLSLYNLGHIFFIFFPNLKKKYFDETLSSAILKSKKIQ